MTQKKFLVLGHMRHGKDTVAELLRDRHGLSFISSSWFAAERVMLPYFERFRNMRLYDEKNDRRFRAYDSVDECFEDRVNFRDIWHQQIAAYNTPDKAKLPREILEVADMYVGMRANDEYQASKHLFDHIIWVDAFRRGLPAEPQSSFNIDRTKEMIIIDNSGSLEDLTVEVDRVMQSLGLFKDKSGNPDLSTVLSQVA